MTLAPVPRPDISVDGVLKPTWQAWFYQLYSFVTSVSPGAPVPSARQINTTAPLTGGGDLSSDLTLALTANGITNALLAQMPANTIKGNNTAGSANALDLTIAQVNAMLGISVGANPTASVGLTAVNGVATTFLRSDGAPPLSQAIVPTWSAQHTFTLAPIFSSPLLATSGGTGFASYTQGDLLYASSGAALSRLADVAAGSYLRAGGVGANPLWSTVTLPNTATQGDLWYASAANVMSALADVAAGSFLRSGGVSTAPAWSAITVPNAAVLGDVWYSSAASVVSALAGNTVATKKFLTQTGTGAVSAAPGWNTIASTDLPGSFNGFANPTASVGLSTVNGAAATAMRSDGAPALSQAIVPLWTGLHTFQGDTVSPSTATTGVLIGAQGGTVPMITVVNSAAAANAKIWRQFISGNVLSYDVVDDAYTAGRKWLDVTRSTTAVSALAFGNATDNPTYSFLGTSTPKHGGSQLIQTSAALTNNAAALTATMTNSPTTGNPTKWIPINDNGTIRNIPAW